MHHHSLQSQWELCLLREQHHLVFPGVSSLYHHPHKQLLLEQLLQSIQLLEAGGLLAYAKQQTRMPTTSAPYERRKPANKPVVLQLYCGYCENATALLTPSARMRAAAAPVSGSA